MLNFGFRLPWTQQEGHPRGLDSAIALSPDTAAQCCPYCAAAVCPNDTHAGCQLQAAMDITGRDVSGANDHKDPHP